MWTPKPNQVAIESVLLHRALRKTQEEAIAMATTLIYIANIVGRSW